MNKIPAVSMSPLLHIFTGIPKIIDPAKLHAALRHYLKFIKGKK